MRRKRNGPYLEACGKCNVPMKVHPVKQCPYTYAPIKRGSKIVGYELKRKNGHQA